MNLFRIEDEQPILTKEARMIKCFNRIIMRDKDRNKSMAMMELAYVYFMCDYKSDVRRNYTEAEWHTAAMHYVGLDRLEDGTEWKPDELVEEAIEFYRTERVPSSQKLLDGVIRTLESTNESLSAVRDSINKFSKEYQSSAIVSMSAMDDLSAEDLEKHIKKQEFLDKKLDGTLKRMEQVLKLVDKIPSNIKQIRELTDRVQKEIENEDAKRKGGRQHNPAEDPDFFKS